MVLNDLLYTPHASYTESIAGRLSDEAMLDFIENLEYGAILDSQPYVTHRPTDDGSRWTPNACCPYSDPDSDNPFY